MVKDAKSESSLDDNLMKRQDTNYENSSEDGSHKVASKEHNAVLRAKMLVIVVLLLAVGGMATFTYVFVSDQEYKDFEQQFQNYASEVVAISKENAANTLATIDAFSDTVTSYTSDTNKTWPFVTIPNFEARGAAVTKLSGARLVSLATVVQESDKNEWEDYVKQNVQANIQDGIDYEKWQNTTAESIRVMPNIFKTNFTNYDVFPDEGPGPYLVAWQVAPFEPQRVSHVTNYNFLSYTYFSNAFYTARLARKATLSFHVHYGGRIDSSIFQPIYNRVEKDKRDLDIVGALWVNMDWGIYFQNLLPANAEGIVIVLKSSCGPAVTYQINGTEAELLGYEDQHDSNYDHLKVSEDFISFDINETETFCVPSLSLDVYPTDSLRDSFRTYNAIRYTVGVIVVFLFTSLVFIIYDYKVRRRQEKVMARVISQDRIVSDMFPSNIRDRLYDVESGKKDGSKNIVSLQQSFVGSYEIEDKLGASIIADLFPKATVCFADICGFTAWSSAREPQQVFLLLESIYGVYDKIAHHHGVFKVETVGDCYVAVAGLPEPREDHALAMARFARDCMQETTKITSKLEVTLGPDTADLEMRMGLHSGQVIAGVLRGERSRFQLFGDTVNTTSRMESTSERNRIQISDSTATLLCQHEKSKWIQKRKGTVSVKGKGEMQTYWLELKTKRNQDRIQESFTTMEESWDEEEWEDSNCNEMTKMQRLVEWNIEVLSGLLQQILATRVYSKPKPLTHIETQIGQGSTVLEEFKEIITLPQIGIEDLQKRKDPNLMKLDEIVVTQLRDFLNNVADMYCDNAFHNFEHASHVTASVRKLLTRIVCCNDRRSEQNSLDDSDIAGHSYGITSDPLTQFSVVFSAIIHDAGHPGVPNTQLVKEKTLMSSKYKEKSVAEQNSVDIVWDLLMSPKYKDLRACVYSNENELRRFRQLVVNTVMATDICDEELGLLRKARWAQAFSDTPVDSTPQDDNNRKATIVIEHLIQASDVSHTMQHWQIYKQWNERFFFEMYSAFRAGRADSDPAVGWYKGEIGFFDYYVIPLAKKLESCGVFGVSSHEYLNYAKANRDEWVLKGQDIVKDYLKNFQELHNKLDEITEDIPKTKLAAEEISYA